MRTIKFRAWDKETKDWAVNLDGMNLNGIPLDLNMSEYGYISRKEREIEFMQYVGLLDRNRKEIYEGDIVAYVNKRTNELYQGFEVKWTEVYGEQGVYGYGYDINPERIEIIGNIYENPELLK